MHLATYYETHHSSSMIFLISDHIFRRHYYTKMLGLEFPNNWLLFFSIESFPPLHTPQNLPTQQDTSTGLPIYAIILISILPPLLVLLTIVATAIVCIWRYKKKTQKKCVFIAIDMILIKKLHFWSYNKQSLFN